MLHFHKSEGECQLAILEILIQLEIIKWVILLKMLNALVGISIFPKDVTCSFFVNLLIVHPTLDALQ